MPRFINIAFYRFTELRDLPPLRAEVKVLCASLDLKGTILLSPEGMNGFLAGTRENIDAFKTWLLTRPGFEGRFANQEFKESESDKQPFRRMLVRLKREIIALGDPSIQPAQFTGPRISAREFKQWLDEGKEVVVLDTRNDYEARVGTFKNAVVLPLRNFRNFPEAVDSLAPELRDKPIVTFCTGGIRCEKASPVMLARGFKEVYQLDGGILKYFEEVGGEHWEGECFVFDQRVALTPQLEQGLTRVCYNCQEPLSSNEFASPDYVYKKSCPYCVNGKPVREPGLVG